MARRRLTEWEKHLKAAADELGLPRSDFRAERLATLQVLMRATRQRWADGKQPNAAGDIVHLLDAIAKLRADAGLNADRVSAIKINIVETLRARCPHCGKTSEVPVELVQDDSLNTRPPPPAETTRAADVPVETEAASIAEPPPANVEPLPSQYVEGKSPSAFNSQRGTPLKRLQPGIHPIRSLSPMSH
jgi:hypothetical protein